MNFVSRYMKARKILAAALVLAGLCVSAAVAVAGAGESGTLKVISMNIRNGEANDGTNSWQYRCPASLLMINELKPDILGLQEAYYYQVLFLTENLRDYKAAGVGREDGKKDGEHMSILYNRKTVSLKKWGTFWLSETPDEPSVGWDAACKRTATWAIMKDRRTGNSFLYVNTHLDHVGKQAQEKGLALIMDRIAELNTSGLPVILTGDFNVKPGDPVLDRLDNMMKSARIYAEKTDSHATYNNWGKSSDIIDYIYYSGFRSCPEFRTVTQKFGEWPFISDHYPVEAVLVF